LERTNIILLKYQRSASTGWQRSQEFGRRTMGTRRHRQEGALVPLEMFLKCFVH